MDSDDFKNGRTNDPGDRIQQIIQDCIRRRVEGDIVSDEAIIGQNADLMPELGERLRQLRQIEKARRQASQLDQAIDEEADGGDLVFSIPSGISIVHYFGDYILGPELGRGAMGVVYRARQVSLPRVVALKMMLSERLATSNQIQRFHLETQAAATLDHPGIVQIYEVGQHEGQYFFTMAYIEGENLARKIQDGPLPGRKAAQYIKAVAEAIHYAHERGVIHRDIKPANLIIDRERDEPHVTDYGLAKQLEENEGFTASGQILGTPEYMPPEQAKGDQNSVGVRSDIYSLGATLYHLLTGRPPFQAGNLLDMLAQVCEREPVSPRMLNSDVALDLDTICLKCLEKDQHRRYTSAQELAEELGRFLEGRPIVARPVSRVERTWKWCKRNPLIAALAAAVMLALTVGMATSTSLAIVASKEAVRADEKADEALTAKELADQKAVEATNESAKARAQLRRARTSNYAADLLAAQQAIEKGDCLLAETLLLASEDDLRGWEYHHLYSCLRNRVKTMLGHTGDVECVAISPDGHWVVSGGTDENVIIWDMQKKELVHKLKGHNATVLSVAFSPSSDQVASGGADGSLIVWNTGTGEKILRQHTETGPVVSIDFNPDGTQIATAGVNAAGRNAVRFWSAADGSPEGFLPGFPDRASCVAFSPDGGRLAACQYSEIQILDVLTHEQTVLITHSAGCVRSVSWSPDGRQLAAGNDDNHVRVFDAITGENTLELSGHAFGVSCVAFSSDGRWIASSSRDETIKIWDSQTGREASTLTGHRGHVCGVAFSPDGQYIVSGGRDDSVKLWSTFASDSSRVLTSHADAVSSVMFTADSRDVLSSSWDRTARVSNVASGKPVSVFSKHAHLVSGAVCDAASQMIVTSSWDNSVRVWDRFTAKELLAIHPNLGSINAVALSPNGKLIAADGGCGRVQIYRTSTGTMEAEIQVGESQAALLLGHNIAFSPNGTQIIAAGSDGELGIWDPKTGKKLLSMHGHEAPIRCVAFSPDGKQIVSGGDDNCVRTWDAETGREVLTLRGHTKPVLSVVFSSNPRRIVSGSSDHTIKVWDVVTGEETLTLKGHGGAVYSVAFSPDDSLIASGSQDGTVRIWDGSPNRHGTATANANAAESTSDYLTDELRIRGGQCNDQSIGPSRRWITVKPGESISGWLEVAIKCRHNDGALVPFGYTVTWGNRIKQITKCTSWCGPREAIYRFSVEQTAPKVPGKYFLVVACAGAYTFEQVFSNTFAGATRAGLWNDGNDKGWDWVPSDFEQAQRDGSLTEVYDKDSGPAPPELSPADWIGIQVVP